MSRARTLAGAIGSDGALNVADVAGLAAVASSGSASDLSTGTLPIARLPNTGYELGFKNLLINGDARISQRRGSSSVTTPYDFLADRWYSVNYDNNWAGANSTMQRMDMPPGTLLGGEHFTNFMRITPGSTATRTYFWQHIENLQQFDSRTITLSYWARIGTGTWATSSGAINRFEFSHDSASSTSDVYGNNPTFTTTWQKFTTTITVPSFSGKTFGANSYLSVTILSANDIRSYSYFDITGIQLEYGSVATPFERRHIEIEDAMCKRYFQIFPSGTLQGVNRYVNVALGSGALSPSFTLPVAMRNAASSNLVTASFDTWTAGASTTYTIRPSTSSTHVVFQYASSDNSNSTLATNNFGFTTNQALSLSSEI